MKYGCTLQGLREQAYDISLEYLEDIFKGNDISEQLFEYYETLSEDKQRKFLDLIEKEDIVADIQLKSFIEEYLIYLNEDIIVDTNYTEHENCFKLKNQNRSMRITDIKCDKKTLKSLLKKSKLYHLEWDKKHAEFEIKRINNEW